MGHYTSMVVSATGAIEQESDYSSFGTEYVVSGADSNHYKFTGKERDTESQLDYFGARYYSKGFGRWTTTDPMLMSAKHLMSPQRWNQYAYVRNNPLSLIDLDGLDDFYVFRPVLSLNSPQWDKVIADAKAHGNTVHMFNKDDPKHAPTVLAFKKALGTTDAHVIDSGHTVLKPVGDVHVAGSVHLKDGDVGTLSSNPPGTQSAVVTPQGGFINPAPAGDVNASTVGIFGCNSNDLQSQYSNTAFTGIYSGNNNDTTIGALDAAAAAYTEVLVTGGTLDQATAAANAALAAELKKENEVQDGDKVITTTPKKETKK